MNGWLVFVALAALAGLCLWRLRLPRSLSEMLGAALLIAVAGYAWQGSPGQAGVPVAPPGAAPTPQDVALLDAIRSGAVDDRERVLETADRLVLAGQDRDAVDAVQAVLARHPRDADLWVGLANAVVAHDGGVVSPAARVALGRAAQLAPGHPGPPFFLGLAYAQSGQTDLARSVWFRLLQRTPPDAPWRSDLQNKLRDLAGR